MKLNYKLISVVVLIQALTGILVFTMTRAYYMNTPSSSSQRTESRATESNELSTEELIRGLQEYSEITSSNNPNEINQEANLSFQKGDYERAATLYHRVIELSSDDAGTHNNLGLTLYYLNRSTEALEILKRGIELQPEFQRIWLTLGFVQSGVGNIEAAKEAFNRAIELDPNTEPGKSAQEMISKLP